tara:strand:- start:14895 stop:15020 length:126 start_codon:yes stop_codon:yes gene_type:complete
MKCKLCTGKKWLLMQLDIIRGAIKARVFFLVRKLKGKKYKK